MENSFNQPKGKKRKETDDEPNSPNKKQTVSTNRDLEIQNPSISHQSSSFFGSSSHLTNNPKLNFPFISFPVSRKDFIVQPPCLGCKFAKVSCIKVSNEAPCQRCIFKETPCFTHEEELKLYIKHLQDRRREITSKVQEICEKIVNLEISFPSISFTPPSNPVPLHSPRRPPSPIMPFLESNQFLRPPIPVLPPLLIPISLWVSLDGIQSPILCECNEAFLSYFECPPDIHSNFFLWKDYIITSNSEFGKLLTPSGVKMVQIIPSYLNQFSFLVIGTEL